MLKQKNKKIKSGLPKLVVILGPTASGKTSLAIKLAKKFGGEIVSADSRAVYREMDIATAKPQKKEMQSVPHHLLSVASIKKQLSVAEYQKLAVEAINKIQQKNKTPFLVGGSAFYIYPVVEGWQFPKMKSNSALRSQLERKTEKELFEQLKKLSPQRAKTIDKNNKRRLVRAVEIALTLGEVPKIAKAPIFDCLLIGIKQDEKTLKKNISQRVDKMIKQGLEQEAKKLFKKYGQNNKLLNNTIGYAEWLCEASKESKELNSFDNRRSLTPSKLRSKYVAEMIKLHTLQFSKKQMTWFRRNKKIAWVENYTQAERLIKNFLKA